MALAALLLAAAPGATSAQVATSGGGAAVSYVMPLDALPTPTACYSERRLRTAYATNKGINIVRASDSTTTDVGFTAAGYPNKATETTFCNATTCKLVTMYDQCGSRDITQATDGNRYTRQSGPGGFNASQATASTQTHAAASNITPATGLMSLAGVTNRSAGTASCHFVRGNAGNNRIVGRSAATGLSLAGGTSGFVNTSSPEAAWHASAAVLNGASSVYNADGTDTTGTATGNTTAGAPGILGAASTTCNEVEAIIWDNVALTAGERLYYANAARAAWGF